MHFQSERETVVSLPLKQPTLVPAVPAQVNRCWEMVAAVKGWLLSDWASIQGTNKWHTVTERGLLQRKSSSHLSI